MSETDSFEYTIRRIELNSDGSESVPAEVAKEPELKEQGTPAVRIKRITLGEPDSEVKADKPAEPVKPVEPVKPAESAKPVEPVKPAESAKPVETAKPVESAKPAEPEKPVEAVKPAEPEKPIEAEKFAESAEPENLSIYSHSLKQISSGDAVKKSSPAVEKTVSVESESFDYIVPAQRKKYKGKHHKKHAAKRTGKISDKEAEEATSGYVYVIPGDKHHSHKHRSRKRKRRLKGWKKVLIVILSVILALVIAIGGTYFILREIGRNHLLNLDDATIVTPTENTNIVPLDSKGQIINYKGTSYELNKDMFSITVIGVDDSTISTGETARMADAIYILAVDTKTGKIKVLGVSRDTMTDVDVYSVEGHYIDTETKQISFSYSYSSDEVTGGMNTSISLSRLFFGLPLENYFAINMDALKTINDSIGGVTLTSSITFVSPEDGRTISEGDTVTLHGREAEQYVRQRDRSELESNSDRMKRQQQYINAFIKSIIPAVKEDISRISTLYNMTAENSDSNMSLSDIVYIASTILPKINNLDDIEFVSLQGKITEGEYAEMRVSNDDAITAMLEVFYRPIS